MLLDHRGLEVECVLLGGHHDVCHVGDGAHQQVGAQRVVRAVEVRADAALQVLGLADIDDGALRVVVRIDSGGVGQDGDFLLEGG